MATLTNTANVHLSPTGRRKDSARQVVVPSLLRCAVISWHPQRREQIRRSAEQEAWESLVCNDLRAAMRCALKEKVPLAIVDLPPANDERYSDYKELTHRLSEIGRSGGLGDMLLTVCTSAPCVQEEIWVRQLGAWSYLPLEEPPSADDENGMPMVFREARKAVAQVAARATEPIASRFPQNHLQTSRMGVARR